MFVSELSTFRTIQLNLGFLLFNYSRFQHCFSHIAVDTARLSMLSLSFFLYYLVQYSLQVTGSEPNSLWSKNRGHAARGRNISGETVCVVERSGSNSWLKHLSQTVCGRNRAKQFVVETSWAKKFVVETSGAK